MVRRGVQIFVSFLCLLLLFSVSHNTLTYAAGSQEKDYKQLSSFWTMFSGVPILRDFLGYTAGLVCPQSEDGYHHASSYEVDQENGYYNCVCTECGWPFTAHETDLQQAYEAQVSELPFTGITSTGSFIWYPNLSEHNGDQWEDVQLNVVGTNPVHITGYVGKQNVTFGLNVFYPVTGTYTSHYSCQGNSEAIIDPYQDLSSNKVGIPLPQKGGYTCLPYIGVQQAGLLSVSVTFSVWYEVVPNAGFDNSSYPINSRPTSFVGNYGIIGDNGQITQVDNSSIVNETNNTYTNPCTGTTSTITEWTYDYSDRSYNVTTESGDTVAITYGDENITIQEGDTVYNVYYLVDDDGTPGGEPGVDPTESPAPETCQHEYTAVTDREATCTFAGQVTYTCSLCGHSYTESIPATGHAWDIKESVQTSYDEEGNLLQQGYTIYKCSVCGEEYKDETGTGPPGSGDGSGSGSGEEGESIWDKLGNLLGTIFGTIIDVISAVLGAILDALIALVEMIGEKLVAVVNLVLSFFDEIPRLFSGFLAFLTAVFPFLPDDIMLLLTFGIAVIVFIGIIKALRR